MKKQILSKRGKQIRKRIPMFFCLIWLLVFLFAMPSFATSTQKYEKLSDFEGKRIAVLTGTRGDEIVMSNIKDSIPAYYNDIASEIQAVLSDKVDAWSSDRLSARLSVMANKELAILNEAISYEQLGFAFQQGNELKAKAQTVIDKMTKDGSLQAIMDKWTTAGYDKQVVEQPTDRSDYDGSAGVIRLGYDPAKTPAMFISDGVPAGFDIDILTRVAYDLNMQLQLVDTPVSARVESLDTNRIDIASCGMTVTPEREKKVDFVVYYQNAEVLVVKKSKLTDAALADKAEKLAPPFIDLDGVNIGAAKGTASEGVASEQYPNAILHGFESNFDAVEALKAKKIQYVAINNVEANNFMRYDPTLLRVPGAMTQERIAFSVTKQKPELREKLDKIVGEYAKNGTLDEIAARWFIGAGEDYTIVDVPELANAPVLQVAMTSTQEPFSFMVNGKVNGFAVELIKRIAYDAGMGVVLYDTEVADALAAVKSGKSDVGLTTEITEERKLSMDFTSPYLTMEQCFMGLKEEETIVETVGFLEGLKNSFTNTFVTDNRYQLVLCGLGITILISLCALVLGTAFGALLCGARLSRFKVLHKLATFYVRLIQGLPIVLILMVLYYIVFGQVMIPAELVAIIGFSLNFAAYTSEIFRTAIDATDKGQVEAAYASGFSKGEAFFLITLPQALRHILPVFKGEFVSMVKMTSVVGYIAIQDLTKVSDIIRSRTYEAFFPLIATAVLYFAITYVFILLLNQVEAKIDPKKRKRNVS